MTTDGTSFRTLLLAVMVAIPGAVRAQEPAPAPTTHYVDNLADCAGLLPCHPTIMDAVEAAAPYDSIEVFPGVYHESVVLEATSHHVTLQAHARAIMPVIAAPDGVADAVIVKAPGAQIRNFIIEAPAGIAVLNLGPSEVGDGATDTIIQGNSIRASRGIVFSGCRRSVVTGNSITAGGISLERTTRECLLEGNTVEGASIRAAACSTQTDNVIRRNVVRGGDIAFPCGDPARGNTIESNRVEGGGILLASQAIVDANLVRRNLVRGGGIELAAPWYYLGANVVELNFVSGSPRDGIRLHSHYGGSTLVRKNTSVENIGCDLNDTAMYGSARNTWTDNRSGTRCGSATD